MLTDRAKCLLRGEFACCLLLWKSGTEVRQVLWMTRRVWRLSHRIVGMIETVLSPLEV
jgi:hypothetical protein